jgi:ATPase subunit of ABC transporter with duplicated ATPase domains
MLQVSNVSRSFADNLLFERVSFTVNHGQRVGLVGPNGCGKTTLLKIILGEVRPDTGSVRLSSATMRVGYLAQALEHEPNQPVGQVLRTSIAGLSEAEERLERLSAAMATSQGEALERLLLEYDQALDEVERLGGYSLQARSEAILEGLGLHDLSQDLPVDILSGGQKTRLGLARLLLSEPDLLLLDEPTNHLDIEALEWLERFLQGFDGGVVIVSHDRTFLDRCVSTILEMDPLSHTVGEFPGNYSDYLEAKIREREKLWAAYKDQQAYIAHLEGTITAKKGYARSIEQGTIDFGPRKIAKGIARKAVVQQRRIQRLLDSEERSDRPGRYGEL